MEIINVDHLSSMTQSGSINSIDICELNDDCLIHIFQYLTIIDRIRLERVCKRWQSVSKDSWYDFKSLAFYNDSWGFKKTSDFRKISLRILKKVLGRCGQYITAIDMSFSPVKLGRNVLSTIAKFCPNVDSIDAPDLKFSPDSIKILADRCSKITSLSLGDCNDECDYEFSLLFQRNRNLRELILYSNYEITGECLLSLNNKSIETIIFVNCPFISLNYLSVIQNFKNLKTLTLEHFHDLNDDGDDVMQVISTCFDSLQYLTLSLYPFYSNAFNSIKSLKNLKTLDLSSNFSVTDELLVEIGRNCKLLKYIDISYCHAVTNVGLSSIVSLPQLKALYMLDLEYVSDEVFTGMPNLVGIDCSYCTNIRNAGLVKLIKYSENIEHMHLSGCTYVTNELVEKAIEITKKRQNEVILKLYANHTGVRMSEVTDASPFLRVIPMIKITFADGYSVSYANGGF